MVRCSVIAFDAYVSFYCCKNHVDEHASRISKVSNSGKIQYIEAVEVTISCCSLPVSLPPALFSKHHHYSNKIQTRDGIPNAFSKSVLLTSGVRMDSRDPGGRSTKLYVRKYVLHQTRPFN